MEWQVLGGRASGVAGAAASRYRDFDADAATPSDRPREWFAPTRAGIERIGWTWERVELENYLIDPIVVQSALGARAPKEAAYREALEAAAESIAPYAAARIALSLSWPPKASLPNRWGDECFGGQFRFPPARDEQACRQEIRSIVAAYEADRRTDVADVLARYDRHLEECRPGGIRRPSFLVYFSGKDLVLAMQPYLDAEGLGRAASFVRRVAAAIDLSSADVWEWLPEWGALRTAVAASSSTSR